MDTLRANIINIYGESGKKWLLNLNQIVKNLQKYWNLKEIKAINNLTYNYVARASNDKNNPVILKIGCDKKIINDEINALKYFNNNGSIALLDYNHEYNAILLEQAIPGITLKSLYPKKLDFVMENFLLTISKLHDHSLPDNINFPSISSWLESIDKIQSNVIPKKLVDKAITLKAPLLSSIRNEKLLHGDLHLDNILKNDNEWLAIDPKGIIGDVEFEIAAFDFIANNELDDATSSMFKERIEKIANKAKLSSQRIKDWTFVRLILSAAWSIEDEGDPS